MTRTLVPLREVPQHREWLTVRQLRRMVSEHRIAYHRVNGRILFDLNDVDSYSEAGRVESS
jgi:hypothetical protein